MMYYYRLFHLTFASEWAFPGMQTLENIPVTVDVVIRQGPIPEGLFPPFVEVGTERYFQASGNEALLQVKAAGYYWVRAGREIVVQPNPSAHRQEVVLYLLGSALGILLHQRRFLVLHGNTIVLDNQQCVIFVGPSGVGKSTLAYAFHRLGYEVLADDVSAIYFDDEGEPWVAAGYPRIKLWKAMTDHYALDAENLERVTPSMDKYQVPIAPSQESKARRLAHVYVLAVGQEQEMSVNMISGAEIFTALKENTYRYEYLPVLQLQAAHFQDCCQLANRIKLFTLQRPAQGCPADKIAKRIIHDHA